jgi:hypothetical protein
MWDVIQQRKFEETNYSANFTFEGFCVRPKVENEKKENLFKVPLKV